MAARGGEIMADFVDDAAPTPVSGVTATTALVLADVLAERRRQIARWGDQSDLADADPIILRRVGDLKLEVYGIPLNVAARLAEHYDIPSEQRAKNLLRGEVAENGGTWFGILLEEVCEALAAIPQALADADPAALIAEVEQVAAVAVAWSEALCRRGLKPVAGLETIRADTLWARLCEMTDADREAWFAGHEISFGHRTWTAFSGATVERHPATPLILLSESDGGYSEERVRMESPVQIRARRG
jgi:hypothetical protein